MTSNETIPDFSLPSDQGTVMGLKDLPKRATMIRFSTTHCHICASENPDINQLSQDTSVEANFVDINIGEQAQAVLEYRKKYSIPSERTFLLDQDASIARQFEVLGTPTHVFVSADGTICERGTGKLTKEMIRTTLEGCAK